MGVKSVFKTLETIDLSQHIKSVQNQRYVPWHKVWGELLKNYPMATYEVHENEVGDPFFVSTMGIMIKLSVTIEGITRTINHPVLNNYNKSLKVESYSYKTKKGDMHVPPCSSFDINTSIMRALTKCIALHGLGLYIYQDEISPDVQTVDSSQLQQIMDKIKINKLILSEVLTAWGLQKIALLHDSNFDNMMSWLESQKKGSV